MQKNRTAYTRALVFSAICSALSVILGKLLQIPVGNSVRISFESLPILFASLTLGGVWGAATGLVADLVGCLIMAYEVNPFITLGAVLIGVIPALFKVKSARFTSVFLAVLVSHAIGNMCVKSFGLYLYYGTPWPMLLLRVAVSFVAAVLESVILFNCLNSGFFHLCKGERA